MISLSNSFYEYLRLLMRRGLEVVELKKGDLPMV